MASKSFQVSIDFIGNVGDLQSKIKQVSGEINKIGSTSGGVDVQKQFDSLAKAATELQTRLGQPIKSQADFNKITSDAQKIELSYNNLIQTVGRLQNLSDAKKLELLPADQQSRIKQAEQAVKNYEATTKKAAAASSELTQAQGQLGKAKADFAAEDAKLKSITTQLTNATKKYEELRAARDNLSSAKTTIKNLDKKNVSQTSPEYKDATANLQAAQAAADQLRGKYDDIAKAAAAADQTVQRLSNKKLDIMGNRGAAKAQISEIETEIEGIKAKLSSAETSGLEQAFTQLAGKAKELGVSLDGISGVEDIDLLTSRLLSLKQQGLDQVDNGIAQTVGSINSITPTIKKMGSEVEKAKSSWTSFAASQQEFSMFENQVKQFFSLTNSIQLMKRTIQSAINTVKELDAVMTETAVVTDFSIGDMWDKLPEYASKASQMGSSIKDLYSATTLYYQQGLDSDAAMSVGVETMKMARIAGMDAADATTAMTAALRGFNMEVNEVNAQRVNDVYSELAAITASDTEQIATAMSKTASIASSANMDFETTSALLAQIIETTQEAPETAGTAMKTIIARFTEVKDLFSEGMLSGKDAEGEEININKIDAALKTVGISLTDFLKGEKGIDDIFLELASKWDTLDLATQRYIATTAAGSRQQSRFIAMMSNYDRTMELVTAANNSAGASQEQFDKTMESLESKLQQLQNAWNQFTMGIANSDMIKGGIDMLTGLLETVNKLINAISGKSDAAKGIISLMSIIGALKGGKALLSSGFGFVGEAMGLKNTENKPKENPLSASLKTGQINAVKMAIGGNSQQQGMVEGQQAGRGYIQGLTSTVQGKAQQVLKNTQSEYAQISSGFFANKLEMAGQGRVLTQNYLAQAVEQNPDLLQADPYLLKDFTNTFQTQGIEAANKQLKELGGNITGLNPPVQALQVNFQSVGMAAAGVGTAISLLGNLFEKLGLEELANLTKEFSGGLIAFGSVLTMLGPMLNTLGITLEKTGISFLKAGAAGATSGAAVTFGWLPVIGVFVAVAAVLGILIAGLAAAKKNSPEIKLESSAESANQAAEAADEMAASYETLADTLDAIEDKESTLDGMTRGTSEWKSAVADLNAEVLKLVEQFPELASYVDNSKGYLRIDKNKEVNGKYADDILNDYNNKKVMAQSASIAAKMKEQQAKEDVEYQEAMKDIKIKEVKEVAQFTKEINNNAFDLKNYGTTQMTENGTTEGKFDAELSEEQVKEIATNLVEGNIIANYEEEKEGYSVNYQDKELFFDQDSYNNIIDYGNSLNQAKIANETYASAVLANAASMADVPDTLQNDMTKFWNSGQIERIFEVERNKLDKPDGLTEQDKKLYADKMGYNYSAGSFFKGDAIAANKVEVAEDDIKDQLAGMIATENITTQMNNIGKNLENVSEEETHQYQALMSGNLDNLTISELLGLGKIDNSKLYQAAGFNSKEEFLSSRGYEDVTWNNATQEQKDAYWKEYALANNIDPNIQYARDRFDETQAKDNTVISKGADQYEAEQEEIINNAQLAAGQVLESIKVDQETFENTKLSELSSGALSGLSEQMKTMGEENGIKYRDALTETISSGDLKTEDSKILGEYLSNVNWKDMSQAIGAMDYMQQMGLDDSAIEKFWNTATEGADTYVTSMAQSATLTENFQNKIQNVDDLGKSLEDGTATAEQLQQLINAGIDTSKLELTPEGYKASAEEVAVLTHNLRKYYAEQAKYAAKKQREKWDKVQGQMEEAGIEQTEEGFAVSEGVLSEVITSSEGKLIAQTVPKNMSKLQKLAKFFEIDTEEYKDKPNELHAAIQSEIDKYIDFINNNEEIQTNLDKTADMMEAGVYSTADKAVSEGASDENVRKAMKTEAEAKNLDTEEVVKYAEAMEEALGVESKAASQIAIDYALMKQGMEEVTSTWDQWQQRISMDNPAERNIAYKEMADAANKMLGVEKLLNAEFFKSKENMEMLKKAAEGDVDAFNKLQKAAGQALVKDLNKLSKTENQVAKHTENLSELIENFDDAEINVGDIVQVGDFETGALAQQLTDMYAEAYAAAREGGKSVEEAMDAGAKAVEAAGYEPPEIEVREMEVTSETPADMIPVPGQTAVTDAGTFTGVDWQSGESEPVATKVAQIVPKGQGKFTKKAESVNAKSKGGGGGGGGGGKKWENSFDKLYNVQENIDRATREREKIERRYQRLIDRRLATAQELQRASQAEIESLKEQAKYQQQMVDGRKEMLLDEIAENSELEEYATVNVETGQITIDWELINSVTDEEEGSAIEEYVSKLEELRDSMREAQDALEDINDAVWEIEERGREEYMEFEDRIKEALVEVRQKEIDTLEEINESINDANTKLLDSIQQSIDKMRQDRENERTEEDLQEKQRQLAYLEQDTSGANAMEILELQEEIRQGQEDYTDALIDQKISELQEQNDAAAEQREKQITLLQNQLDWTIESGRIWAEVDELLKNGLDPQGGLIRGSKLEQILKSGENWVGLSSVGQMDWLLDLETLVAQSMNWQMTKGQLENLHESVSGQEISFKNAKGETVTGKVDSSGKVWTGSDTYYKDVYKWIDGTYHTTESSATKYTEPKPTSSGGGGSSDESGKSGGGKQYPYQAIVDGVPLKGSYATPEEAAAAAAKASNDKGTNKNNSVQNYITGENKGSVALVGKDGYVFNGEIKKYRTGGLADFTGPAWLDGTKSRPELVLNQHDTQNFIQLKDILSSIMSRNFSNASTATENNGDITYDIDINVETMGSDYDVEQVANKVKSMINEDARYRNNNAISLKR